MLNKQEKNYIKQSLFSKFKFLRYGIYIFLISIFIIELSVFLPNIKPNQNVILSLLTWILYPLIFSISFYIIIEILAGNQLVNFLFNNYSESREIVNNKYTNIEFASGSYELNGKPVGTKHIGYYFDTTKHVKLPINDVTTYKNASIGDLAIVLQFGKSKNNYAAFVLPK